MLSRVLAGIVAGIVCLAAAKDCSAQLGAELISNPLARQLGLERAWAAYVRVDPSRGRVESVRVHRGICVVQTSQGVIQCLDAENGRAYWTSEVGKPSYPTLAPAVGDKFIGVTNGATLYLLDRATGALLWQQRLGGSPSAGPAIDGEHIVVPLDSGILESYKLEREALIDHVPQRYMGTGAAQRPPVIEGNRLLWTTPAGYVYSRELSKDVVQFRFRMNDDAVAAPLFMSPFVYAASRRGTVYCLDQESGLDVWSFSAGNSISHRLVAINGALYVVTETGDMVRLDPRTGHQVWHQVGVGRFLAQSSSRVYVVDMSGQLAVLDAASGARLGAMPIPGLELQIVNADSDRIYLGTTTGLIQCLREVQQTKPLEHVAGFAIAPEVKPGAAPAPAPADGTAPAEAAPPAGGAAPAAANPFGS